MSMPICDAINNQFDSWDMQIEDLKNKSKEAAREQAEKIKKDIENYMDKKGSELENQKNKVESKSQAVQAIDAIKSGIDKVEDAVSAINKILEFLGDIAGELINTSVDIMAAPAVLTERSAKSLKKLTEI